MENQTDAPSQGTPTPPPQPGTGGLQPNVAAGLAALFSIIGGIVFLIIEKKNAFVRFYAMQAVFLGGLSIVASIVFGIVFTILGHIPVIGGLIALLALLVVSLFWLAYLVVYLITIIKAFSGVEWEVPILGAMARKQLESSPV